MRELNINMGIAMCMHTVKKHSRPDDEADLDDYHRAVSRKVTQVTEAMQDPDKAAANVEAPPLLIELI